jgi:hypothetical protein
VKNDQTELGVAPDDRFEHLLRDAVDPMQVLDHHDDLRETASGMQETMQQVARSKSDQDAVEAGKRSVRRLEAEKIEQQAAGNPHRWAHKRHARRSPITIKIVTLRERCTMTSHAASALAALPIPKATRKAARQSAMLAQCIASIASV